MNDAMDLLMGGGGKYFSWKDVPEGTTITGTVNGDIAQSQQTHIQSNEPLFWDPAKTRPKMQIIIPLDTSLRNDTEDDGKRTLWVNEASNMQAAIRDAVKTAGASSIAQGGTLSVTFTGTRPSQTAGFNPVKLFSATYQPPAQGALMAEQQASAPAQPVPNPAVTPAPDPKAAAAMLIGLGQSNEQIAAVTGLSADQVQSLRVPF